MAFRKFGGIEYNKKNNFVFSNVNNNINLGIVDQIGQLNTKIIVKSHLDLVGQTMFNVGNVIFANGLSLEQLLGNITLSNEESLQNIFTKNNIWYGVNTFTNTTNLSNVGVGGSLLVNGLTTLTNATMSGTFDLQSTAVIRIPNIRQTNNVISESGISTCELLFNGIGGSSYYNTYASGNALQIISISGVPAINLVNGVNNNSVSLSCQQNGILHVPGLSIGSTGESATGTLNGSPIITEAGLTGYAKLNADNLFEEINTFQKVTEFLTGISGPGGFNVSSSGVVSGFSLSVADGISGPGFSISGNSGIFVGSQLILNGDGSTLSGMLEYVNGTGFSTNQTIKMPNIMVDNSPIFPYNNGIIVSGLSLGLPGYNPPNNTSTQYISLTSGSAGQLTLTGGTGPPVILTISDLSSTNSQLNFNGNVAATNNMYANELFIYQQGTSGASGVGLSCTQNNVLNVQNLNIGSAGGSATGTLNGSQILTTSDGVAYTTNIYQAFQGLTTFVFGFNYNGNTGSISAKGLTLGRNMTNGDNELDIISINANTNKAFNIYGETGTISVLTEPIITIYNDNTATLINTDINIPNGIEYSYNNLIGATSYVPNISFLYQSLTTPVYQILSSVLTNYFYKYPQSNGAIGTSIYNVTAIQGNTGYTTFSFMPSGRIVVSFFASGTNITPETAPTGAAAIPSSYTDNTYLNPANAYCELSVPSWTFYPFNNMNVYLLGCWNMMALAGIYIPPITYQSNYYPMTITCIVTTNGQTSTQQLIVQLYPFFNGTDLVYNLIAYPLSGSTFPEGSESQITSTYQIPPFTLSFG